MLDENNANSDDFGGISGRDCHGLNPSRTECGKCYDLDCSGSAVNIEMSIDTLISELV